jgi:hypothetical protein
MIGIKTLANLTKQRNKDATIANCTFKTVAIILLTITSHLQIK